MPIPTTVPDDIVSLLLGALRMTIKIWHGHSEPGTQLRSAIFKLIRQRCAQFPHHVANLCVGRPRELDERLGYAGADLIVRANLGPQYLVGGRYSRKIVDKMAEGNRTAVIAIGYRRSKASRTNQIVSEVK